MSQSPDARPHSTPRRGSYSGRQRAGQTRRSRTRAGILRAYGRLFAAGRFDVSVEQLAEEAGVSPRSIYGHAPEGVAGVAQAFLQDLHLHRQRAVAPPVSVVPLMPRVRLVEGSGAWVRESLSRLLRQGAQEDSAAERTAVARVEGLLRLAEELGDRDLQGYACFVRGRVVVTRSRCDALVALDWFRRAHELFSHPDSATRHDLAESAIASAQMLLFPTPDAAGTEDLRAAADYLAEARRIFRETRTYHPFFIQDALTERLLGVRLGDSAEGLDGALEAMAGLVEVIPASDTARTACAVQLAEIATVAGAFGYCSPGLVVRLTRRLGEATHGDLFRCLRAAHDVLFGTGEVPTAISVLLLLAEPSVSAALAVARLGGRYPHDVSHDLDGISATLLWTAEQTHEAVSLLGSPAVKARATDRSARKLLEELILGPVLHGDYTVTDARVTAALADLLQCGMTGAPPINASRSTGSGAS